MVKKKRILVVQYEQSFDLSEYTDLSTAVREGLDVLRGYGGARVIGSYVTEETKDWLDKAVDYLTVDAPVIIEVD